jgi:hypothetical protein
MIFKRNLYPIIIGGFYRSGTTLLRRILDSHSNIHCGPEVKFFKDLYGDYLKDDLKHARFFGTVRSLGLRDDELLDIFGKSFIQCHELAARKAGKKRWADKTPENILYMDKWTSLLGNQFFFIHVVRHPLDALASLIEIGFPKAIPAEYIEKVYLYKDYLEHGLRFSKTHPDISMVIRYEDLVTEPKTALAGLLNKIGEIFEPSMIELFNDRARQQGIEDPKTQKTTKIHTLSIGRWKRDLSKEQIRTAITELGDIAGYFGYQQDAFSQNQ